ncbi:MAG: hypothetical protein ACD_76C00070G0002 [uncultured bacterium]|nr:MAG: hypothetical protein ACD_76C00070G0002 [uncultured bacterium]
MRIFVKAKPLAGEEKVEKLDDSHFIVSIKEPPVKGQANRAIIGALADYFHVTRAQVAIVSGGISRNKIIEIK